MGLSNQEIQTRIDQIKTVVTTAPPEKRQQYESDEAYTKRLEMELKFKGVAVVGLDLLSNVLQNINDIAHAMNSLDD